MINKKAAQLKDFTINNEEKAGLTTNQGLKVAEDEFSLKAGLRGPTLMEDFHFREKMTHFDHERIPERIVHARGVGAHKIPCLSRPGFSCFTAMFHTQLLEQCLLTKLLFESTLESNLE